MRASLCLLFFMACLAGTPVRGSGDFDIPCPLDNTELKYSLWRDPSLAPQIESDRKRLYALEGAIRTKKESELKAIFGPETEHTEAYVLPFARHTGVGFSGIGYEANGRRYFLPIKDLGGVLVFPLGARDFVSSVALYLKTDEDFRALKKRGDLKARREWELKKLNQLAPAVLEALKTVNTKGETREETAAKPGL